MREEGELVDLVRRIQAIVENMVMPSDSDKEDQKVQRDEMQVHRSTSNSPWGMIVVTGTGSLTTMQIADTSGATIIMRPTAPVR